MSENDTPPVYTIDTMRGRLDLVPKANYDEVVAALRDINMICAQAPPLEDFDDQDDGYGQVLTAIQSRVRKAFTLGKEG